MHWMERWIHSEGEPQDVGRGRSYFDSGRVRNAQLYSIPTGDMILTANVRGSSMYQVGIIFDPRKQTVSEWDCNCIRCEETGFCKHIVATALQYVASEQPTQRKRPSYADGSRLLQSYLEEPEEVVTPIHLQPKIVSADGDYPFLRFSIGQEKLYAVRNVRELAKNVAEEATVDYGKRYTLTHRLEDFDPTSKSLMELLMNEYSVLRSNRYRYESGPNYGNNPDPRTLRLDGLSFDRFFELFEGQELPSAEGGDSYTLRRGDPEISFSLKPEEDGALLKADKKKATFFGNGRSLYAVQNSEILRCSPGFQREAYPILRNYERPLFFDKEELPTLSAQLMPRLERHAEVKDPKKLMERHRPEECIPRFYCDLSEEEGLTLHLEFCYGDRELTDDNAADIRRDLAMENRAQQLVERSLIEDAAFASLSFEDKILTFLTEKVQKLQALGEVYLSDSLKRRQIRPKTQPVLGVSVSEGVLTLDMDTGEFPAEELEALYDSLLKKKKYHRLADGRFLELDGSGYETLAQAAHILQLSKRDLQKGQVQMPAFRGLYLQELLGDQTQVAFRRDSKYRELIRAFKTVADSEFQVPAQMESVLRPYQATGFRWLKTLEQHGFGGLLADEMGLGKTIQMIAWFLTVPKSLTGLPNLVVCPASLILNWGDEFRKFAPELKVQLLMGTAKERQQQREEAQDADVWVTSYDLLKRDVEEFAKLKFYACVLDEGQNIKNQSTLASKSVKRVDCCQRFVLTGTPIENRLSELWNLFDFLMPGYLFSHNTFVQKLEKPIAKSGNPDAMQQLRQLIQPFLLRRLKSEVLKELPDKLEYLRKVPLSEGERKTYQAAAHNARQRAQSAGDKLQILALLTQLRQLCCDPNLLYENYKGDTSKLDACVELCQSMVENGHQILLFSQFTTMLDRIRGRLADIGIDTETLQGSTPKEKRARLVKDFQAGKFPVFLISLKAGGTGLNLTEADVVIHYDPWWNLSAQNQATDRAHRMGQRNCVQVYKLIAQGTLEEKIIELQEKKAALTGVLSGDPVEPLSREELLELMA